MYVSTVVVVFTSAEADVVVAATANALALRALTLAGEGPLARCNSDWVALSCCMT
jgi:hypothetical protein